jgi:hypothetical protein
MLSPLGKRTCVSGVQNRQDVLSGDRASPMIRVGDEDAKRSLTEPRCDQVRLAMSQLFRREACLVGHPEA